MEVDDASLDGSDVENVPKVVKPKATGPAKSASEMYQKVCCHVSVLMNASAKQSASYSYHNLSMC